MSSETQPDKLIGTVQENNRWWLADYARNPLKRSLAEIVAKKDGLSCQLCVKDGPREKCLGELELDHIDGNPQNWDSDNLRLLGKSHNLSERNRLRSMKKNKERENPSHASISFDKPITVQMNQKGEPAFKEFVIGHILHYGDPEGWINSREAKGILTMLDPLEVQKGGANWSGMNLKTCYPYMGTMTNLINGFISILTHEPTKSKYMAFRFKEYYSMTVEEIVKLNPKEGLKERAKA